jgi:hypothetical protein
MADHEDVDIFVYMGGRVPEHFRDYITHARVEESVGAIDVLAFMNCPRLLHVEFHDGVDRVERRAFSDSPLLRGINLTGVTIIGEDAFNDCDGLVDVEFGNKLERIEECAFTNCTSLRHLNIPSIRTVERYAFWNCSSLTDAKFGEGLESIGGCALSYCGSLRRIAIPLRANLFTFNDDIERFTQFDGCKELATVEIVGGGEIHKTISHLSLQSWRNKMNHEINRINEILPTTPATEKTGVIQEWVQSVLRQIEHYKAEHHNLLKEATTLLELGNTGTPCG